MRLSGVVVKIHTGSHIRRSSASAKLTRVPEVVGRELARELARDARFSAAASSSASSFLRLAPAVRPLGRRAAPAAREVRVPLF